MTTTSTQPLESARPDLVRKLSAMIYARKFNGDAAYIRVGYNHSTRPYFDTVFVDSNGNQYCRSGHPRTNGVTRANNWSIDPEMSKCEW